MSEAARMWMEISFNIVYLIVIWGLVILMALHRNRVAASEQLVARLVMWAFALLALGDTGHVGFRVVAYALGDLETPVSILGREATLVGLGALSTAVTVTFFYVLMLFVWRERFDRNLGWQGWTLLAVAALRLSLMVPAANQWSQAVPPQPWSLVRNIPLTLLGLGIAYLILRDARRTGETLFTWIGVSILVSYACYIPVILFVQRIPGIGMLMIPKTMAYVAIAILVYQGLYSRQDRRRRFMPG